MDLKYQIEELISQGASDFEISKVIKSHIKNYLNSLDTIFEENQGKDFLVKHTKQLDSFLILIFKYTIRKFFGDYMPFQNQIPITLIAMGSYGREELCIYSDIDLMVVYKDIPGYNIEPIIESMLYLAWDSGLKLGHRTHKVEEIFDASNTDLTIKTAMLESRFLYGSNFLWMETVREINRIRNFELHNFIKEKLKAHEARRKEYPISMEPEIKNGIGGLRDTNTLFWIAKAILDISKLKDLVPKYIDEEEFREFRMALEFLFRVRSALHISAKKKQDRLNLEYIPDIAKKLGFQDKKTKKAQVELCEKTLAAMHTIDITTQIFLKKLTSSYMYEGSNIAKLRKNRLERGIYNIEGTLFVSRHQKPISLLNLLQKLLKYDFINLHYDISFVDFARKATYTKKNSTKIYRAFKALLFNKYLYETLVMLYDAKLLPQIVKPMAHILNLPQFDGYHEYPVDKHSVLGLYHLEHIQSPFIQALFDDLCDEGKALLRLVILLHDIGKGRSVDHSELGALLFRTYAAKLQFSEDAIKTGNTLIKYHTLMSNIANKEDIYSEEIVLSFITKLGDIQILKLLYILTYCDVNAVGENIYTNFNAKLLRELYGLSVDMFDKKELIGETKRRLRKESSLQKYEPFKELSKMLQRKTFQIASNLFFIKLKPYEIVEIVDSAKDVTSYKYRIENVSHLSIVIIKSVDFNLGYLLGKLSFLDLSNMDVFKLFDKKKYFKIDFNEKISDEELPYVKQLVEESFDMSKTTQLTKPVILPNELDLDCEHSKSYAKMTINAKNQRGMMAYMMSIFDQEGIEVANAKILTIKNRARNLILIEKKINLCDNKQKILEFFI